MNKTHITISVDYNAIEEHRQLGNNISGICNNALIDALDTRPVLEKLKESTEQFELKKNLLMKEFEEAKQAEKADRLSQLKVAGTDYLHDQRVLLENDYKALKRMLLRCSNNALIPRKSFDEALNSKAEKLGISSTELANDVFDGGIEHINKTFKERK